MNDKINIFTDKKYLNQEYRKIIFPVLLDIYFLKTEKAIGNYNMVEKLTDADVVIVPIAINYYYKNNKLKELNLFIDTAIKENKKVWVYSAGDQGITFRNDVTVFRLGGFKTKLKENEQIMPSFVMDPYEYIFENKTWEPLNKEEKPHIGFVGHAKGGVKKWIKEFLIFIKHTIKTFLNKSIGDFQPFFPSSIVRYKMLIKIKNSKEIYSNFIFRDQYRGGSSSEIEKKNTTLDFFNNIDQNLYTFCMRGAGNFSVRLYETLVMGRIPVLLNTDNKLPLENQVNWNKHIVIVNKENFVKRLIDFHNSKSNEEIIKIQQDNRNLVLHLLNRVEYFKNFT